MSEAGDNCFTSFYKLFSEADTETVVTLEFLTPTSFKGDGIQTLFPEPKLVFSSLLRRWNTFSDIKIAEEHLELLPSIKVSNYDLRTELIHFSKYKMLGFKGKIEYRLLEKCAPHFCQAVNALANFAFYSGVGTKTTMGMGQTRRIK
jgi:CRISPR-associated endoribonuclease Cas6